MPVGKRSTGFYADHGKRLLDIVLVLIALPILVPMILFLALAVAMDGAAPFYWQERLGRGGRVFRLLKLRSMVPDADAKLEAYLESNPEARREWEHSQKLKSDPRTTSFGRFLRKSSLDELPQFWNVLIGEMSLVGPRPMMVDQSPLYPGVAYYYMRPGISGLWQVSDRNNSSFVARAAYDGEYYKSMSLKEDLSILFRTLLVVIRGTGY